MTTYEEPMGTYKLSSLQATVVDEQGNSAKISFPNVQGMLEVITVMEDFEMEEIPMVYRSIEVVSFKLELHDTKALKNHTGGAMWLVKE